LAVLDEAPIAGVLSTCPNHVPDLFIIVSPTNSQLPHQHKGPELLDVTLWALPCEPTGPLLQCACCPVLGRRPHSSPA
jgi:hypothetical protein